MKPLLAPPIMAALVLGFLFAGPGDWLKDTIGHVTGGGFLGVMLFVAVAVVVAALGWTILEGVFGKLPARR